MPRRLSLASVVRVFRPRSSVSSTGHSSHILIKCQHPPVNDPALRISVTPHTECFRSTPRGRRRPRPDGRGTATLPPPPPLVRHCGRDGKHIARVEGRPQISAQHQHRCRHADPIHSRRPPIRDPLSEGFSHFVTSMTAPVASGWSGWPGGICTHWKAPPCHGARCKPTCRIIAEWAQSLRHWVCRHAGCHGAPA